MSPRQPPAVRLRAAPAAAYPENTEYRDEGCKDVSPRCTECPLAQCIYEMSMRRRAAILAGQEVLL